ncbi:MAG: hypothetical protein K2X32_09150 [Phycisphaerales bacterium]|nr:hypothetical protein [Phycisphaerales bacterium]
MSAGWAGAPQFVAVNGSGDLGIRPFDFNGFVTPAPVFISAGAGITRVESVGGSIYGDISAATTISDGIYATESITSIDLFENETTGTVVAPNGIATITAGADLNSTVTSSNGTLTSATIGRDVRANISVRTSPQAFDIRRDLRSNVSITNGLSSTGLIRVGRDIAATGQITVNSSAASSGAVGLAGQVIVSWQGSATGLAGQLLGSVRVNRAAGQPTLLVSNPAYSNVKSELGGGAVGLAPFTIKGQDSVPMFTTPTGGIANFATFRSGASPVVVSFRGPVTWGVSESPVQIRRCLTGDCATFDVIPTSDYTVTPADNGRDLVIRPTTSSSAWTYARYQVVPTASLRANLGLTPNPSVSTQAFPFALSCFVSGIANPCDIANDNGTPLPPYGTLGVNNGVTEGDYNLFFSGYFTPEPWCDIANDAGQPLPGDPLVPNNGVTEGDYNAFFAYYFEGCSS